MVTSSPDITSPEAAAARVRPRRPLDFHLLTYLIHPFIRQQPNQMRQLVQYNDDGLYYWNVIRAYKPNANVIMPLINSISTTN